MREHLRPLETRATVELSALSTFDNNGRLFNAKLILFSSRFKPLYSAVRVQYWLIDRNIEWLIFYKTRYFQKIIW